MSRAARSDSLPSPARATARRGGRRTASSIAFTSDRDGAPQLYRAAASRRRSGETDRPQGRGRRIPLVAGRHADRRADGRAETRGRSRRREGQGRQPHRRQGRSASRASGCSTSRSQDAARRSRPDHWQIARSSGCPAAIASPPSRHRNPQSISSPTAFTRSSDSMPAASTRWRRRAARSAASPSRPTARRSPTSAHASMVRRRTISACSRLAGGAPQNLTALDRSTGRRSRGGSTTSRWSSTSRADSGARSPSSVATARRRTVDEPRRQSVRLCPIVRRARSPSSAKRRRAPELWLKSPSAPAARRHDFNAKWSSIPVVAPEFVKYKSAGGIEIEAALLIAARGCRRQPRSLPSCRPRARRADRPMERRVRGVGTTARRARLRRALSKRARFDRLRPAVRRDRTAPTGAAAISRT